VSDRNDQPTSDVLDRATAALRDAAAPEGPPPGLVASTVEALQSLNPTPDAVRLRERRRTMLYLARYGGLAAAVVLLAVAAGAFRAHALRERIAVDLLDVFETGARYQIYHALALVAVGLALARFSSPGAQPWLAAAGWLFVAGTVLFSGSLYALARSGTRWLGAITPLGGVAFLLGWLALAVGIWRD
jgi:uncharacterized membrane protein YgdD (TMEM256/DUF423 family)